MKKFLLGLIAGIVLTIPSGVHAAGMVIEDDGPAGDVYATTPIHYMPFMNTHCTAHRHTGCYVAKLNHRRSYYVIRIGHRDCLKYWGAAYNRRHGHCRPAQRNTTVSAPTPTPTQQPIPRDPDPNCVVRITGLVCPTTSPTPLGG